MTPDLYAYTLCNRQPGWAWSVYDIEGRVVASGVEKTQPAAARAVDRVLGAAESRRSPPFKRAG